MKQFFDIVWLCLPWVSLIVSIVALVTGLYMSRLIEQRYQREKAERLRASIVATTAHEQEQRND